MIEVSIENNVEAIPVRHVGFPGGRVPPVTSTWILSSQHVGDVTKLWRKKCEERRMEYLDFNSMSF
jgi:hypothetical protein